MITYKTPLLNAFKESGDAARLFGSKQNFQGLLKVTATAEGFLPLESVGFSVDGKRKKVLGHS